MHGNKCKILYKQHYIGAWIFSENPATGPEENVAIDWQKVVIC